MTGTESPFDTALGRLGPAAAARRGGPPAWALAAGLAAAVSLAGCFGPGPEQKLAAARQALERGDVPAAVIEAKNYLGDKPESAAGRFVLGRALLAGGDLAGADTELQRAERLGHAEAELAPALAELWLAQRRPQEVVTRFESKQPEAPRAAAEVLTLLARSHRELGAPDKAQQALALALGRLPGHVPALVLGARLAAERGDAAAALATAGDLVSRPDAPGEAWLLQGDLLAQQPGATGTPALEAYRKAIARQPRLAEAHVGLIGLMVRQGDLEGARTQLAASRKALPGLAAMDYLEGLVSYLRGDLARAREMTDRLESRGEPAVGTLVLSGLVQARLGNLEQAESRLATAVAAAPQLVEPRRELAVLLLRQGHADRALELLRPLAEAHPDDAAYWTLMGQGHARRGDFKAADAAFARARALRPGDAAVRTAAAKAQIARGQAEAGLRELEAAAQADVDGIASDLVLVAAHARGGDRRAALAALDALERKKPGQALPSVLRGRLLEDLGDRSGARAAYMQAVSIDARSLEAVSALAAMDRAEGKPAEARKRFEALVKADPASAPAQLALADTVLRTGGSVAEVNALIDKAVRTSPKNPGHWRSAIALQRQLGDPQATLSRAQAATAALPDDPLLLLDLAAAQAATGAAQQSLGSLRRAAQLRPKWAEAHLRLAVAHGAAGNVDAAREPLKTALALAPDGPDVLRGAIALAVQDRQPDRARALAREQQRQRPTAALGWDLEAELEAMLGQRAAAAAAYREGLQRERATDRAVRLHKVLASVDPAAARRFEDEWLKSAPRDALFLAYLAEAAQEAGDAAQAESRYRRALQAEPANALLLNNLASLLLARKDPEALVLAQRAQAAAPWVPEVLDTLASAQAQAGKHDLAARTQQQAVDLRPASGMLRLGLARHLAARGEADKAREQLAAALRLGLQGGDKEQAERLRRQLGDKG